MSEEAKPTKIYPARTDDLNRHWVDKQGHVFTQTEFPGSELSKRQGGNADVILMLTDDREPVIGKRIARRNGETLPDEKADLQTLKRYKLLSALGQHPNVVNILGLGQGESGSFFILEQYVEGETVGEWFTRPHSALEIARLSKNISDGLNHINAKGFIHKDLKPDSVRQDVDGKWVIVDCGSMFNVNDRGNEQALVEISNVNIAPEEAEIDISLKTDVYYLTNLLFDVLTYDPQMTKEQLLKQLWWTREIPLNSFYQQMFTGKDELKDCLSDTVIRGFDPNPEERHANVIELNREIQMVFEGIQENE